MIVKKCIICEGIATRYVHSNISFIPKTKAPTPKDLPNPITIVNTHATFFIQEDLQEIFGYLLRLYIQEDCHVNICVILRNFDLYIDHQKVFLNN